MIKPDNVGERYVIYLVINIVMEELLSKLIERGWKPYWIDKDDIEVCEYSKDRKTISIWYMNWVSPSKWDYDWLFISLRELVSRESWLWQFCIANHLLKKYSDLWDDYEYVIWRWQNWMDWKTTDWEYIDENYDSDIYHQDESYQRWLIESSLKDKSELEDFLLNNINVEW